MAVSLSKGGNVSLSKEAPGLTEITVGWAGIRVLPMAPSSTGCVDLHRWRKWQSAGRQQLHFLQQQEVG